MGNFVYPFASFNSLGSSARVETQAASWPAGCHVRMRKSEKIMQVTRDTFIHIITAGALIAAIGAALPAAHAADVIKIGAPLALTGSLADEGKKHAVVWKRWLAQGQ